HRATAEAQGAEEIIVGATSASRDAENREELVDFVRRETGLNYEIISGEDEARWSFAAAVSAFRDLEGRCTVIDIGGGSTEIAIGDAGSGVVAQRRSLQVGSVRLTERLFSSQPPLPGEIAAAERLIESALAEAGVELDDTIPFIGAAGTVVALALLDRGVASWDEIGEASVVLSADVVHAWREKLLARSFGDVLALNPDVMTGRADVFPAGVLLLDTVMRRAGIASCRVSPWGLRHGLALRFFQKA
ncbi:MAG: exopolyphosphatase, partial [Rhodothermales bacterium]